MIENPRASFVAMAGASANAGSTPQNIPAATWTKLRFDTLEGSVPAGIWADSRLSPALLNANLLVFVTLRLGSSTPSNTTVAIRVRRNGTEVSDIANNTVSGAATLNGAGQCAAVASTDYFELWIYSNAAVTTDASLGTFLNRVAFLQVPMFATA